MNFLLSLNIWEYKGSTFPLFKKKNFVNDGENIYNICQDL